MWRGPCTHTHTHTCARGCGLGTLVRYMAHVYLYGMCAWALGELETGGLYVDLWGPADRHETLLRLGPKWWTPQQSRG